MITGIHISNDGGEILMSTLYRHYQSIIIVLSLLLKNRRKKLGVSMVVSEFPPADRGNLMNTTSKKCRVSLSEQCVLYVLCVFLCTRKRGRLWTPKTLPLYANPH
jgi:hypothetical protein